MTDTANNHKQRFLSISAESDLLLAALSGPWHPEARERVRRLADGAIDWNIVRGLAESWRLEPLLYETLRQLGHPRVPADLLKSLGATYQACGRRNLLLALECLRILGLYKKEGIRCAPYKGPLWASRLYGNLSLRRMADLDFLIPLKQIPRAVDLLRGEGFALYPLDQEGAVDRLVKDRYNYDIHMYNREQALMVELHYCIIPEATLSNVQVDFFWDWLVENGGQVGDFQGFPCEEQFFLICIHNAKHCWHHLRFLVDVVRMIESYPELNWGRIHRLCDEFQNHEELDVTLRVIQDILNLPVPQQAWTGRFSDKHLSEKVAMVRARLFYHAYGVPSYAEWCACLAHVGDDGSECAASNGERESHYRAYLSALLAHEHDDHRHFSPWLQKFPAAYSVVRVFRFMKYHFYRRFIPSRKLTGFDYLINVYRKKT